MGLSVREQWTWWGIAFVLLLIFFWYMGNALAPYLIGAGLAYVLDPWADWLEEHGFSRIIATVIITTLMFLVFLLGVIVVLPVIFDQARALIEAAPGLFERARDVLFERFPSLQEEGSPIRRALANVQERIQDSCLTLANGLVGSLFGVFDFLMLAVISPVVAFYLLFDWDRLIAAIDSWLPRQHADNIRQIARDIDRVLAGFMRGQLSVVMILAIFYATALGLIGLDFGVFVGMFAGLISFIPFVGSILGGALAVGLAIFQFWGEWWWIVVVGLIFLGGQAVEGNVLTPFLVGGSAKLHPVMLMFALSAFGTLFGFIGLIIAVPVMAALGVVARFALAQYLEGRLYNGPEGFVEDDNSEPPNTP